MTPCIPHDGALDPDGYGRIWFDGKWMLAHRAAWLRNRGPIPSGMDVLHSCDNRPCVNSDHHFLGTHGDNNRDRAAKGRSAIGEQNGRSKLMLSQVIEIRSLLGNVSLHELGRRFGVDWTTIRSIRDGETWRDPSSGLDAQHESPVGNADAPE